MERVEGEWESCGPATSQILGPPGTGFSLREIIYISIYGGNTEYLELFIIENSTKLHQGHENLYFHISISLPFINNPR